MKKKSPKTKRPRDLNKLAFSIIEEITVPPEDRPDPLEGKNPHAVALGRLGGLKGGKARISKLTPEERRALARKAALARWGKKE